MSDESKPVTTFAAWFFNGVQEGATCKVINPDGTEPEVICNVGINLSQRDFDIPKEDFIVRLFQPVMSVVYNYMMIKRGGK